MNGRKEVTGAAPKGQALEELYNRIAGDEDARVCKDIPEAACNDQPRNFFAYLAANLLGKVADEIASAKLIIPWLFGALGVPALLTGFLVPIREAGVLLAAARGRRGGPARALDLRRGDSRLGLGYKRTGAGADLSRAERHARGGTPWPQGISGRHGR